jgi:8-oxo-dGTP pyrophosphatase MutT (NUDIX family)
LSILPENLKRRLFFVVARTCFALYRWFPIFGPLRSSVGIIYRDGKFLMVHRNDGRGVSLPGGIASRGESEESGMIREVREETGLEVTEATFEMKYFSNTDVPCNISVFRATATGELRNSWEGSPRWMTLAEIEAEMLESQKPVLDLLRRIASN